MTRPSRAETYSAVAATFAERSTCLRGHVGAVILQDKHIISHGYNGAPAGMPQCLEHGCIIGECICRLIGQEAKDGSHSHLCPAHIGCQRAIHAEANAIAWAARFGVTVEGAT